jgi:hypothetical protein
MSKIGNLSILVILGIFAGFNDHNHSIGAAGYCHGVMLAAR